MPAMPAPTTQTSAFVSWVSGCCGGTAAVAIQIDVLCSDGVFTVLAPDCGGDGVLWWEFALQTSYPVPGESKPRPRSRAGRPGVWQRRARGREKCYTID